MQRSTTTPTRLPGALCAAVCVGILVWAPAANAQSAADQYIPELDKASASDDAGASSSPSGGAPTQGSESPGQRKAPATPTAVESEGEGDSSGGSAGGFPVTGFVAGLAVLVLLALLARTLTPLVKRGTESIRAR